MFSPKRVLVPTDFSEVSDRALEVALDLAEAVGAEVVLLHAYDFPLVSFPDGGLLPPMNVSDRIVSVAEAALEAMAKRAAERGVHLIPVLREGSTTSEILKVSSELGCDMIVVGTHGRRGLARALLGSVAETVIRASSLPVLAVHARPEHAAAAR